MPGGEPVRRGGATAALQLEEEVRELTGRAQALQESVKQLQGALQAEKDKVKQPWEKSFASR